MESDYSSDNDDAKDLNYSKICSMTKEGGKQNECETYEGKGKGKSASIQRTPVKLLFSWNLCKIMFKNKYALKKNKFSKHFVDVRCIDCEATFPDMPLYKMHVNTVHSTYECQKCGVKKLSETALNYHLQAVHKDDLQCPRLPEYAYC